MPTTTLTDMMLTAERSQSAGETSTRIDLGFFSKLLDFCINMSYNTHANKYYERKISMKKFLAILMVAAVCATVAFSVRAENAEEEVPETTTSAIEGAVSELQNDERAEEIANDIVDAVKTGAAKEDIADLISTLEGYINNKGIGTDELQDPGAVRDVVDAFLTDAGVDTEALNNAISNSIIANKALELYYKPEEEETTTEPEEEYVPVEEPEIPACGFVG